MSAPAALFLAAALARVESVGLVTVESRLAVLVRMTGSPGAVAVHREGRIARVSIADAELGPSLVARRRLSSVWRARRWEPDPLG